MKEKAKHLYQQLQQDLQHCEEKNVCGLARIECCYQTANKYWLLLRTDLMDHEFASIEEEIDFFKSIKPLFTSEIVYYSLVYHAELFQPTKNSELRNLLLRERNRLSKFVWNNPDFYDYYKSGQNDKDEFYFTRANNDLSNIINAPIHDADSTTATSHDYLVAQIIALERYDKYLDEKLKVLPANK
jgi:hypothetical protein